MPTVKFKTDRKINCIKAVRMALNIGLKEAKDAVEAPAIMVTVMQLYAIRHCLRESTVSQDDLVDVTMPRIIDLRSMQGHWARLRSFGNVS